MQVETLEGCRTNQASEMLDQTGTHLTGLSTGI
mgnify:CR=1 FL=1